MLRLLAAGVFTLIMGFAATTTFGQGVTSSGIAGFVTDKDGKPVAGATVTVLSESTGTRSQARTRDSGAYNVSGLQPGGPYTVTVASPNYGSNSKSDIYLSIGATSSEDFVVSSEIIHLAGITVGASKDTTFDTTAMGTGTFLATQEIQRVETVRRDVQDIENLDPRTSLMQVGTSDSQ